MTMTPPLPSAPRVDIEDSVAMTPLRWTGIVGRAGHGRQTESEGTISLEAGFCCCRGRRHGSIRNVGGSSARVHRPAAWIARYNSYRGLIASSRWGAHLNRGDLLDGSNALVSRTARYRQNRDLVRGVGNSIVFILGCDRYPLRIRIGGCLPGDLPVDDSFRIVLGPRRILRPPHNRIHVGPRMQLGRRDAQVSCRPGGAAIRQLINVLLQIGVAGRPIGVVRDWNRMSRMTVLHRNP
jgi:hypothetical protein